MRQIKNFMEAKRPMWNCNECKCITMQCWKENGELCNCGTSSEGFGVEYSFKNWNGKVLKQGSIEEGATPTPPADPTREATAEYTYTFAGWDPEVGPINEDTVYTATYTATVNQYTVTWIDGDGNILDTNTLDYGALPRYEGATPTKTATAQYTYTFTGWSPEITPVTGDVTYTAQFDSIVNQYTVSIASNDTSMGIVDVSSVTVDYGTEISSSDNVLTIGSNTITATAEDGYAFSSWGEVPATVTGNTSIQANFAFGPLQNYVLPEYGNALMVFGDDEASNYINVSVEVDTELGDKSLSVSTWGLFDNEFFIGTYDEEDQNGWQYIFGQLDPEDIDYLISEGSTATDGEWKSGIWSAFQTYYATPNKANADAVITAIEATRDDVSGKLDPITWTIPADIILADWNSYQFENLPVGPESVAAQMEQRWEWEQDEGPYSPYTLTINGRQYYEITPTSESSIEGKVDILGEVTTFGGDVETDETGKETIRIEIFSR